MAAIDGLGHGSEAATAARRAVGILTRHAGEPLSDLLRRCHERLVGTRGVVMSLALADPSGRMVSWIGVGNVQGLILRAAPEQITSRDRLVQRGGAVGVRLPPLQISTLPVWPGDTLILATDGIEREFSRDLGNHEEPQALADRILSRHGRAEDDALILVARIDGRSA
jgi:serine phosphatase RsbU (regulator of sigma subunit)